MKIFITKSPADILMGFVRHNELPFHIEQNQWEFVDDIRDADVVPIVKAPFQLGAPTYITASLDQQVQYLKEVAKDKCILVMIHTHVSETQGPKVTDMDVNPFKEVSDHVYQATVNYKNDHPNHIFYDFYLNVAKAYFSNYTDYDLQNSRLWTMTCTNKSFELKTIKQLTPTKKFLVPNNVRFNTGEYKEHARMELRKITSDDDCYFSDFQRNILLESEEVHLVSCYSNDGAGFIPIANKYYEDSVVSVYVETVGGANNHQNQICSLTEKTFVPLLKGHFILPFSAVGFVEHLKTYYGFRFPEWIDYSYDSIYNDDDRLRAYLKVVKQLKKIPLDSLTRLANSDIDIRKYNRKLIFNFPYDSLHDKVKARINK
jgi:hypothetical protein